MTFESFFTSRLNDRLRQRRLLVVHDPDERYRDIVLGMKTNSTTVLDCGSDILEAREAALEGMIALGEDATCQQNLVLYVPEARSLEDGDRCADPFSPFILAGKCFPDGAGDDYRQLCLQFLPEQVGKIEELFAAAEPPPMSIINSLRSGASESPVLREVLGADGPKDMLVKFLTAGPNTLKKLRQSSHWVKDLKDLVMRTLGLKLEGPKEEVEELQAQLWRYLLFSEFVADLPVELPEGLRSVPHAGVSHEPFVLSLCATLRDLQSAQAAYEEAASRAAEELHLDAVCEGIEHFGERDTFSFEERGFLRQFAEELKLGNYEIARSIVACRQGSFWVEREASRSAEWQLADLIARLMLEIQALEDEWKTARSLDGWIEFYTRRFARVDTIHRSMEQVATEIAPILEPLARVIAPARDAYSHAADKLARLFQDEVAKNGWPSTTVPRAVDTFDHWVESRWKAGERVAYFWIDAMRYELGMALQNSLQSQHEVRLEIACSSLPSLTPIGMASLLPAASASLEVQVDGGKPVASIAGKRVDTPKARADVLATHLGSTRMRMVNLDDLTQGKLPEGVNSVDVLVVKTTDIDSLGESNPGYFIGMLPGVLRKIQLAVNALAEAGFKRAILATDHGFCWMQSTSAGNAVAKPSPGWVMNKDRALLGEGSADGTSLVLNTADAGIRTELPHLAVPKGLATYTAGVTYFHGGISPQECILPVLDIQLKASARKATVQRVDVTLSYRGGATGSVTTLVPTVEISYPAADLFGPGSVRLILQALNKSGEIVGEAATSAMVDPATREIILERGKAIKVPLRLREAFEGEFKVTVNDPTTGQAYASIKLQTAFHR